MRSPRSAVTDDGLMEWLAPPRRSRMAAIAWKQLRESGPIAVAGLAGIVGIAALFIAIEPRESLPTNDLIQLVAAVTTMFGFAIAMVIGVGVSHSDSTPKLNTFWRSRPIGPDLWFWTKLSTALGVFIAVLYIPFMALVLQTSRDGIGILNFETRVVILVHVAIFAAAVAMSCVVRNAVYAAILSIPVLYFGLVSVWLANRIGSRLGWMEAPPDHVHDLTEGQVAMAMAVVILVCTLFAWLATRYDWGRKSRY